MPPRCSTTSVSQAGTHGAQLLQRSQNTTPAQHNCEEAQHCQTSLANSAKALPALSLLVLRHFPATARGAAHTNLNMRTTTAGSCCSNITLPSAGSGNMYATSSKSALTGPRLHASHRDQSSKQQPKQQHRQLHRAYKVRCAGMPCHAMPCHALHSVPQSNTKQHMAHVRPLDSAASLLQHTNTHQPQPPLCKRTKTPPLHTASRTMSHAMRASIHVSMVTVRCLQLLSPPPPGWC